jgi:hypothetical protein
VLEAIFPIGNLEGSYEPPGIAITINIQNDPFHTKRILL